MGVKVWASAVVAADAARTAAKAAERRVAQVMRAA
jgi:hypothetical protein